MREMKISVSKQFRLIWTKFIAQELLLEFGRKPHEFAVGKKANHSISYNEIELKHLRYQKFM